MCITKTCFDCFENEVSVTEEVQFKKLHKIFYLILSRDKGNNLSQALSVFLTTEMQKVETLIRKEEKTNHKLIQKQMNSTCFRTNV